MVTFRLLGSFEIQIGESASLPLGDTLAAKILAYLAFERRYCTRDEIVAACWGAEKVTGKSRLEDEAYQKQVSLLRNMMSGLGLPPASHLNAEPGGLELREGTFTTDVMRFDELVETTGSVEERLAGLLEAEGMRRGYFLDGMHCPWIVADGNGARRRYAAKFQQIRKTIEELQSGGRPNGSALPLVSYCDGLYDAIPHLRAMIAGATREIILCGFSLHLTVHVLYDLLQERLSSGVAITVMMLDPNGRWIKGVILHTGNDEETQKQEGLLALRRLVSLREHAALQLATDAAASNVGILNILMFDTIVSGRFCAVDLSAETGRLFYFPYLRSTVPSLIPGYVWTPRQEGPFPSYVSELRGIGRLSRDHAQLGTKSSA